MSGWKIDKRINAASLMGFMTLGMALIGGLIDIRSTLEVSRIKQDRLERDVRDMQEALDKMAETQNKLAEAQRVHAYILQKLEQR